MPRRAIDTLVTGRVAFGDDRSFRAVPPRNACVEARLSGTLFRLLTTALAAVPDRAVPVVARALAPVHFALYQGRRAGIARNLCVATGETPARVRLRALASCASYNAYLFEFLRLARLTPADVRARTRVEGEDVLAAALSRGRGAIVCGSHIGNWEWFAAWCASTGVTVATVTGVQLSRSLHAHVRAMKRRHRVDVVQPQDGYRTLYRRLERGEIVGLAVDGDVFRTGHETALFGRATALGNGAARLAHRTGAPLLYGTMARVGGVRFAMRWEPPIGGWDPSLRSVRELDDGLRAAQERHIRGHLDQWCMFRPLWQETPRPALAAAALVSTDPPAPVRRAS
jgi:KDO2-lipid IV(A) lauroyltransferase